MKPFEGFKSEAPRMSYPQLPAGAYAGVIRDIRIDGNEPNQSLVFCLEVTEGEYAGYYAKRYQHDAERARASGDFTAKYKGVYRLRIPNPGNTYTRNVEWDVRNFNNAIWAIEQSNPGYHWDWKEQLLKGKLVGFSVRDASYQGNAYTEIGRLEDINAVRAGKVKPMKPRDPEKTAGASVTAAVQANASAFLPVASAPAGFAQVEVDDLPF